MIPIDLTMDSDSDSDHEKPQRRVESLNAEKSPEPRPQSQSHRKTLERIQRMRVESNDSRHKVIKPNVNSKGRWRASQTQRVSNKRSKKVKPKSPSPKSPKPKSPDLKQEEPSGSTKDKEGAPSWKKRKRSSDDKDAMDVSSKSLKLTRRDKSEIKFEREESTGKPASQT